jgi:hypothetical protein
MMSTTLDNLPPAARDLVETSLGWLGEHWDAQVGLVRAPSTAIYEHPYAGPAPHLVRETAQYALGLLARRAAGDAERAAQAIAAVLGHQFDAPDQPYHGTWRRAPEEPDPPANPREWDAYDPNWREFIGTALAVVLIEYEPLLPADLVRRMDTALRRAIAGTLARRVSASYTNIALMCAFLLQYGADRFGERAWLAQAEALATEIHRNFAAAGAFAEYNSPTYYAVDLYALALWRRYAASALLRELGAELEANLWRDIARYYHAGMRNLCGPYDRSYGMDMRQYAAGLGMWIWLAAGHELAPFPDTSRPFEHAWDFGAAATYALPGAQVPGDALPHFLAFQGERRVEQLITAAPRRVASAWLGARRMVGAEDSGSRHRVGPQFHPATIHWLDEYGQVGWVRLRHTAPVDAWAEQDRLTIRCSQHPGGNLEFVFEISAPGADSAALEHGSWQLPGLAVQIATNAGEMAAARIGELIELRYLARGCPPGTTIHFELGLGAHQHS